MNSCLSKRIDVLYVDDVRIELVNHDEYSEGRALTPPRPLSLATGRNER